MEHSRLGLSLWDPQVTVNERQNKPLRILIADDHALVREGLIHTLATLAPGTDFVEAEDAAQVREAIAREPELDLVLLDLFMPGADDFALLRELCRRSPELTVVVLSASVDPAHMRKALDLGASGYIPKSSTGDVMLSALRLVLSGGVYVPPDMLWSAGLQQPAELETPDRPPPRPNPSVVPGVGGLTGRQLEVLACLVEGKSNKQIARELAVSENTVKIHVAAILRALGVNNRTQAAVVARQQGLSSTS